jgi:pimeloyl-ACP methyl ester carboxylesterase
VAGSIGSLWVLRLAQAHPSRVRRLVLLGAAPLTSEIGVPRFIRLLRSPLGRIITRVPENRRMLRKQLAALGHTAGSGPGQIPEAFVDWHLAMSRETDWARHEREMVRRVVGRRGYVADLVLTDDEIASIEQPTLLVYGTADPHRVARRLATVHRPRPAGRAGGRGRRWSPGLVRRPHPHRRPREPVPRRLEGGRA